MSTNISQELDIESLRNPNETDKEWRLKKKFIQRYTGKFENDRLVCLAQCYVNIETMGCRYSDELMKDLKGLIADL